MGLDEPASTEIHRGSVGDETGIASYGLRIILAAGRYAALAFCIAAAALVCASVNRIDSRLGISWAALHRCVFSVMVLSFYAFAIVYWYSLFVRWFSTRAGDHSEAKRFYQGMALLVPILGFVLFSFAEPARDRGMRPDGFGSSRTF